MVSDLVDYVENVTKCSKLGSVRDCFAYITEWHTKFQAAGLIRHESTVNQVDRHQEDHMDRPDDEYYSDEEYDDNPDEAFDELVNFVDKYRYKFRQRSRYHNNSGHRDNYRGPHNSHSDQYNDQRQHRNMHYNDDNRTKSAYGKIQDKPTGNPGFKQDKYNGKSHDNNVSRKQAQVNKIDEALPYRDEPTLDQPEAAESLL